ADVMAAFGAGMQNGAYSRMEVAAPQEYRARDYPVPPDASNASYFFAAAAITGGRVRVPGLGRDSRQGDLELLAILERMGCGVEWGVDAVTVRGPERLRGIDRDMNRCSDMAQTLAAVAPFAEGPTTLR